jgi:ribosomal protein S18 acetylase RimI-like enzyme
VRQQTLRFGDSWARLGPWRGGGRIAHLVVAPDAALTGAAVRDCVRRARDAGYDEMLTSAVGPGEEEPFVEASFTVRERLHLLALDHFEEPEPPDRPIARASRRDRPAVLALDDVAFNPFWRLGPLGLRDALDATPVRQFRVARGPERGEMIGYAITGYAAGQGYLQRVAVHPSIRRGGWGRALVADALVWLWRRGATRAFVNTQLDNDAALALYESFGFHVLPAGLAVMGRSL